MINLDGLCEVELAGESAMVVPRREALALVVLNNVVNVNVPTLVATNVAVALNAAGWGTSAVASITQVVPFWR